MNKTTTIVACPTCKKSVKWDKSAPYRPFCCERCKLIDLGEWASEGHNIPGEPVILDEHQLGSDLLDQE